MSFKKAKSVITVLFIVGLFLCVMALITFKPGTQGMLISATAAVVCIVLGMVVCAIWCRCPHCGVQLFRKVLSLKACPSCGRDFETGKKVKKVKKK